MRQIEGPVTRARFERPGTLTFRSPRQYAKALLAAVRKDVMLKWQEQHHEMELSDGAETYGFVGTAEW